MYLCVPCRHARAYTHTRARLYTDACTDIPTCTHSLLPPSKYMHRHCMPCDVADHVLSDPCIKAEESGYVPESGRNKLPHTIELQPNSKRHNLRNCFTPAWCPPPSPQETGNSATVVEYLQLFIKCVENVL